VEIKKGLLKKIIKEEVDSILKKESYILASGGKGKLDPYETNPKNKPQEQCSSCELKEKFDKLSDEQLKTYLLQTVYSKNREEIEQVLLFLLDY